MTEQEMPNGLELYKAASGRFKNVLAGVKPDQFGASTPCTEWNVQTLVDHVIAGTGIVISTLMGADAPEPRSSDDPVEAFNAGCSRVIELASEPSAVDKVITTRFGEMPTGEFLSNFFMDILVHSWDLAKATGQEAELPEDLASACYALYTPREEMLRKSGAFGSDVPVADDASSWVKLLALMGRVA